MNGTGRAEVTQRAGEQRRRANAVYVVVAVDEHRLAIASGAHETVDGNFRVRQAVR